MGLWIRSQNKEILINTNKFFINQVIEDKSVAGYSIDSGGIELARYSTKEQALKVLDMIQKELDEECEEYLDVFQMPRNNGV